VFVVMREVERWIVGGLFLRRLGATFVERFETRRSVADAERTARTAAGRSLVYFPEGRMRRASDAGAFHLGAFLAATRIDRPVLPIALAGTGRLLPSDRWLPHHQSIDVYVGTPIRARESGWRAILALRDDSYHWIASHRSLVGPRHVERAHEEAGRAYDLA
jgi:1-acyl-sn-glycerol-3-phosphate acyltransferase